MDGDEGPTEEFRSAGRALFSLGLVKGSEGNLSRFDGATLWITRTGAVLGNLAGSDIVATRLEGAASGVSMDFEVHRRMYRERGPGAIAHAHPPGTVPAGKEVPGDHGVYAFGPSLGEAVAAAVVAAREEAR